MRNMVGAIAASAFIACVLVLPQGFISTAQSEQAPLSNPLPAPAAADTFDPAVCGAQGWPYYDRACQRGGDVVRVIKIGQTARR
jgi:hypothetical protein